VFLQSRFARFILIQPALALAIIMAAFGSLGLLIWFGVSGTFATDFSVYWRTANEPLAMAYMPRDELPFPYAPTMLLWIKPLSVLPMWPAFAIWVAISAYCLAKACRVHLSVNETWLVVGGPILIYGLGTGQVSVVLAAILLWSCTTKNRLAAGIGLAVIASIKPQLVLLAPLFLLVRHDWLAFGSAALAFLALVLASILAFGFPLWFEWLSSLTNFHRVLHEQSVLGVAATPAAAAERWHLPPLPFLLGGLALGSWLVVKCRNLEPLETSAAIATGSLMAAPYALTYDLAAVTPFLVAAIYRGSIPAAVALGGALHPIPLALTFFQLIVRKRDGRMERISRSSLGDQGDQADGGRGLHSVHPVG
jgi:Glycosyltransferase family 87